MLLARGASAADMAERGGEQWVQAAGMDRAATILGMEYGEAAGANLAAQTAKTNELNATIAQQQTTADMFSAVGAVAGGVDWGGGGGGGGGKGGFIRSYDPKTNKSKGGFGIGVGK